tara:strand:- start:235 stop:498 length:264 start_codon:yes stop_codon:yes gene_type:complete
MVVSLQQTEGYVMGKMKEIAISIEEMVEQEVYNEWCMVDNYIEESKQYITVHVKDLVNFELQKLGLSMSQQEIQGMVENAINNTYGV